MTITHKIDMDLTRGGIMPRIPMVQGDTLTRKVEISLLSNTLPWQIPGTPRVLIRYKREDHSGGAYDTLADGSPACHLLGNVITIAIAPDVLAQPGDVGLTVSLVAEERVLSTFEITLEVQPNNSTGVPAGRSGGFISGMIPGPVQAQEDQILAVDQLTDIGTVRSLKAIDLPHYNAVADISPDPEASGESETVYCVTMTDGTRHRFTVKNGSDGEAGKSAYEYAREGGFTGTEAEFAAKLTQEFPDTLPNPKKLVLTGAVEAEYDGSEAVTVEIPAGGGAEADTEMVLSDNLLDKSLLTRGQVFYYGASGYQLASAADSWYGFIPLRGAGTYRTKFQASVHSSTAKRIALVNDNNEWVASVTGTHGDIPEDETRNWLDFEFVVTQSHIAAGATRVAFDVWTLYMEQTMIVKDREYPSEYIPYGYIKVATDSGKKQDNVLCGKTAVFLGDSICAGTTVGTDSEYYGYGWAGLIGEANHMNWTNYGKNGGTITHRGSDNTCIASIADTAISEHPAADYVIFEGGCNDADQMREAGLGEISADYAAFDTTTFSGALESLILKLVTAYPHAKIGYIIPQKMYTGYADYTAANHIHRLYFDRAVEICRKWGISVVDVWHGSMLNPKLSTAGVYYVEENGQHLTEAGYLAITPMIEAWMRNMYAAGAAGGGASSWNELTDKPFNIAELMPETQFQYDDSMGYFVAQTDFMLTAGRTYLINWNGAAYTATATAYIYNETPMIAVGNEAFAGGTDNGLPFVIAITPFELTAKGYIFAIPMDGSSTVSVSVKGAQSTALYQHTDAGGPLVVDARMDSETGTLIVYATPTQIRDAFTAGRQIIVPVQEFTDNSIINFIQLIVWKIDQDAEYIMLCSYSNTPETITLYYNSDGTYRSQ